MIHRVALFRVGGQMRHWGRSSHSLGMCSSVVRRMIASFLAVHCQICWPSPHSISLCSSVSSESQFRHFVVEDICILYSPTFVGVRSCMTVYQVILVASWVGVFCRFLHTVSQSVSFHIVRQSGSEQSLTENKTSRTLFVLYYQPL
jgi:hypothetical protein